MARGYDFQVGAVLELESNKYTIKELIDEGGNSAVWKAVVNDDPRLYAIKVLTNGTDKENGKLARFGKECQFCKETDHRHIVKVIDYVVEKGRAYCVMPYYSRNLRTIIDTERRQSLK